MISKEDIIEKIGVLLKELNEKFEHISNTEESIHPLEFQLFEVNAAYFAEHTNILRKLEEELQKNQADAKQKENVTVATETILSSPPPVENVPPVTNESIFFTPAIEEAGNKEANNDELEVVPEIVEELPQEETSRFTQEEEVEQEEDVQREQEIEEEQEVIQDSPIEEVSQEPFISFDRPTNVVEEVVSEKEEASVVEEPAESVVSHEVIIEEKEVKVEPERPMSLNERLSEQRRIAAETAGTGMAGLNPMRQHQESPQRIRDIKTAISLNDKLMFIKDLFNGYSLAYSEAVELLNRFETFDDADRFLKTNYADKNSWETKQASVDKLYAILRKRYG